MSKPSTYYRLIDLADSIAQIYGITCKDVISTKVSCGKDVTTHKIRRARSIFVYWAKFKYRIDNNYLMELLGINKQSSLYLWYERGMEYSTELKLDYR
jgi:hypothetical protein